MLKRIFLSVAAMLAVCGVASAQCPQGGCPASAGPVRAFVQGNGPIRNFVANATAGGSTCGSGPIAAIFEHAKERREARQERRHARWGR